MQLLLLLLRSFFSVQAAAGSEAQQVFYIGTDQHVHHFFAAPGTSWAVEDLTTATHAVLVATGSSLTSFQDVLNGNSQQVFYVGTDQHVHHFFASPGGPWYEQDLTAATGADPAASTSPLTSFEDMLNNVQLVFYIGTDQHVRAFSAVPGTSWTPQDLTPATGMAAAAVGSPLTSFEDILNNVQLVFYIGTDQHVRAVSGVPGTTWVPQDLTAAAGVWLPRQVVR